MFGQTKVYPYPQRKLCGSHPALMSGQTSSTWKTIATDTFYEYAENTKLNGFYYLKRNISRGYVR